MEEREERQAGAEEWRTSMELPSGSKASFSNCWRSPSTSDEISASTMACNPARVSNFVFAPGRVRRQHGAAASGAIELQHVRSCAQLQ